MWSGFRQLAELTTVKSFPGEHGHTVPRCRGPGLLVPFTCREASCPAMLQTLPPCPQPGFRVRTGVFPGSWEDCFCQSLDPCSVQQETRDLAEIRLQLSW